MCDVRGHLGAMLAYLPVGPPLSTSSPCITNMHLFQDGGLDTLNDLTLLYYYTLFEISGRIGGRWLFSPSMVSILSCSKPWLVLTLSMASLRSDGEGPWNGLIASRSQECGGEVRGESERRPRTSDG